MLFAFLFTSLTLAVAAPVVLDVMTSNGDPEPDDVDPESPCVEPTMEMTTADSLLDAPLAPGAGEEIDTATPADPDLDLISPTGPDTPDDPGPGNDLTGLAPTPGDAPEIPPSTLPVSPVGAGATTEAVDGDTRGDLASVAEWRCIADHRAQPAVAGGFVRPEDVPVVEVDADGAGGPQVLSGGMDAAGTNGSLSLNGPAMAHLPDPPDVQQVDVHLAGGVSFGEGPDESQD